MQSMENCNLPNTIFLWSIPRSMSTAFELTIQQLPDIKCHHEPFLPPYLIGPTRTYPLFQHVPVDNAVTFEAAFQNIFDSIEHQNSKAVFVKATSCTALGYEHFLISKHLENACHTFLIRHPIAAVSSFQKINEIQGLVSSSETMPFNFIKESYNLYTFIKDNLPSCPIVIIHAEDLLLHPEETVQIYCNKTGLEYTPGMATKWTKSFTLESMGGHPVLCAGNHDAALNSTGIKQVKSIQPHPPMEELPKAIQQAVKDQMFYYEELSKVAIKVKESVNGSRC